MADQLSPGIGTFISASAATPATADAAGYGALAFTEIGEVTEVPSYGPQHETVTHVPLKTGITAKYHGVLNYGSLDLPIALDRNDAGQIICRDALDNRTRISFRVTYPDGTIEYFQGKVMSFTRGASTGAVVGGQLMIEIETPNIEVAAGTP